MDVDVVSNGEIERDKIKQRCDDIFGIIFEIKTMLDVDSFKRWLKEHHGLKDDSDILSGYQFTD